MDTQSAPYAAETIPQSSGSPTYGGGPGHAPAGSGPQPVTADELPKKPSDVTESQPTLSDQIAANFAALSAILGTGETTSGGFPSSVPSEVVSQPKSSAWIFVLVGAGIIGYILLKRKEENG